MSGAWLMYAQACVAHATAQLQAEIERLQAEVDFRDSVIATHAADTREYQKRISQAEARADMSIFMVIGEGPNGLEIPLVPFNSREDAEEFVRQFPTDGDGYLSNAFVDCNAPYTDENYEHTTLGARLYGALFKDGRYYSGCGGCYRLKIVEAQFGQPMVGWDLD